MGCTVPLGSRPRCHLDPVQLLGGVGEQGTQDELGQDGHAGRPLLLHALVVYLEARLITSYSSGATATGITAEPAPMTTA